MKAKIICGLILALVVALAMASLGCNKTTGGGWFESWDENIGDNVMVSFAFSAQPVEGDPDADLLLPAKGKLQMIAHYPEYLKMPPLNVHGEFTKDWDYAALLAAQEAYGIEDGTEYYEANLPFYAYFTGQCTVNDEDGYVFIANFYDQGEPGTSIGDSIGVSIYLTDFYGGVVYEVFGNLGGGNIQIHKWDETMPDSSSETRLPAGG